jgi:hypothetical protein
MNSKYIVFRYFVINDKLTTEYKYLASNIRKAKLYIRKNIKHFKYDEIINKKFEKQGDLLVIGNNKHGYIIYEEEENRPIKFK